MNQEKTELQGTDEQLDLTRKLLEVEKKQHGLLRIMACANVILAAGIILALILVVPRLISVANDAQSALGNVQTLTESAEKSLEGIDEVIGSANKTVTGAGAIMEDNAEAVEEALSHINAIDFDSLNEAIRDLASVVEPLSKLTGVFS